MTDQTDLNPCPFCGESKAELVEFGEDPDEYYIVECQECGVSTTTSLTKEGAFESWNKRTSPKEPSCAECQRAGYVGMVDRVMYYQDDRMLEYTCHNGHQWKVEVL